MDCLVINLDAAHERMAFMSKQLEELGISFHRIEATTPSTLDKQEGSFNWDSWERPLKDTEKACFLSHLNAWQYVATNNRNTLILEDDALLSHHTPYVLDAIDEKKAFDHVTLEVRGRKKIVSKNTQLSGPNHQIIRLYQDRSGAAAYVLSPDGARKLIARAKTQTALADAMICRSLDLISFQIEPACAVQLDRATNYGFRTTLQTESQINGGKLFSKNMINIAFRARRIGSQLRMAIRAFRHLGVAERRNIELRPEDFPVA